MAELATIARPYAEALFKAAASDLDGAAGWLDSLAAIAGNPQLLQFAEDPKVTAAQVFDVVAGVAGPALPAQAQNFLRTVIDNGRLAAIDAAALADVVASLEKRFGRKLHAKVEVDPSLIGGIRVVVGDEVLDTSVRARLEQMKVALTA